MIVGGVVVYAITQWLDRAAEKANALADTATKPLADTWADIKHTVNGSGAVELTPLTLQRHYFQDDWTLTPDAERTLWGIRQYVPELTSMFGAKGQALKTRYRHLLGVPITKDTL
ncbi:hypothetical protein AT251_24380 [Enterovibrio nigricans]|nr:hypothetical protein AT251_24380 [Enterovibrio nigricans]